MNVRKEGTRNYYYFDADVEGMDRLIEMLTHAKTIMKRLPDRGGARNKSAVLKQYNEEGDRTMYSRRAQGAFYEGKLPRDRAGRPVLFPFRAWAAIRPPLCW